MHAPQDGRISPERRAQGHPSRLGDSSTVVDALALHVGYKQLVKRGDGEEVHDRCGEETENKKEVQCGRARRVVAREQRQVWRREDAAYHGHLVATHALRVLQDREVVLQFSVVQKHNHGDETGRDSHAEGKRTRLRRIFGGV